MNLFFPQSAMVLFETPPSVDDVARALGAFATFERRDVGEGWMGGSPELLHRFDPDRNGTLCVDVVDRAWPDGMGDPKTDLELFGAWGLGSFGPLVFPGNLARATQQCLAVPDARAIVPRHRAFVRIRVTYLAGATGDSPMLPAGREPLDEVSLIARVGRALLDLPGAILYFDPNAEVLADAREMDNAQAHSAKANVPPLELLSHVRLFRIDAGSMMMDTVGLERLGAIDMEARFGQAIDPNEVARFLRNLSLYLLQRGPDVFKDGDTTDGPGGRWRVRRADDSSTAPPRPTLRIAPDDRR